MLLQLLRVAGVDIEAKVAALRAEVETKAAQAAGRIKGEARRLAMAAGLALAAAMVALLGLIVALIGLYRWSDALYGPDAALAIVFVALLFLTVAFAIAAVAVGRSRVPDPVVPQPEKVVPAPAPVANRVASPPPAEDMIDPLSFLLGRYVRMPVVGLPVVDALLRHLGTSARTATHDAVLRGAHLVRTGDRKSMLAVLGAAAGIGWLLVHNADRRRDSR